MDVRQSCSENTLPSGTGFWFSLVLCAWQPQIKQKKYSYQAWLPFQKITMKDFNTNHCIIQMFWIQVSKQLAWQNKSDVLKQVWNDSINTTTDWLIFCIMKFYSDFGHNPTTVITAADNCAETRLCKLQMWGPKGTIISSHSRGEGSFTSGAANFSLSWKVFSILKVLNTVL